MFRLVSDGRAIRAITTEHRTIRGLSQVRAESVPASELIFRKPGHVASLPEHLVQSRSAASTVREDLVDRPLTLSIVVEVGDLILEPPREEAVIARDVRPKERRVEYGVYAALLQPVR
jgi:hypothetical protein